LPSTSLFRNILASSASLVYAAIIGIVMAGRASILKNACVAGLLVQQLAHVHGDASGSAELCSARKSPCLFTDAIGKLLWPKLL
jgi:hypothetical protein